MMFEYVNHSAHPNSEVENKLLQCLVEYCIEHGQELKGPDGPDKYPHMSSRKYVSIQAEAFQGLLSGVAENVDGIRAWYIEETGSAKPFIVVAHDGWDGKRKKIFGITVFFTDPRTLETYRVPIALTPPTGKTAVELSKTTMHGLERAKIGFEDVFKCANDNCNVAKKTLRL